VESKSKRNTIIATIISSLAAVAIVMGISAGTNNTPIEGSDGIRSESISGARLAEHLNENVEPTEYSNGIPNSFTCDNGPWRQGDTAQCQIQTFGGPPIHLSVTIENLSTPLRLQIGLAPR